MTMPQCSSNGKSCCVCGNTTKQVAVYRVHGFPIVRCSGCGVGRTIVPRDFDPSAIYERTYFQGSTYHDYAASEPVSRREAQRVLRHLWQRGAPRHGRLVEVGSAYGFFLSEASRYYDVTGVEISEAARKRSAHPSFHPEDPSWRSRGPFDVAVMLDTIEHLPEPDATLRQLASAMRPRGMLILTTGDWSSVYARVAGPRWRLMTPPQHLYYFTSESLRTLLGRTGFCVKDVRYPWKVVPLGLMAHQLGLPVSLPDQLGLPVNLFDAMRVVAVCT